MGSENHWRIYLFEHGGDKGEGNEGSDDVEVDEMGEEEKKAERNAGTQVRRAGRRKRVGDEKSVGIPRPHGNII